MANNGDEDGPQDGFVTTKVSIGNICTNHRHEVLVDISKWRTAMVDIGERRSDAQMHIYEKEMRKLTAQKVLNSVNPVEAHWPISRAPGTPYVPTAPVFDPSGNGC